MMELESKIEEIVESGDIFTKLLAQRSIFLAQEIDCSLATEIVAILLYLNNLDPEAEITMYINSIGGSITDGLFAVHDAMQQIDAPIKTIAIGEAYSSAAILLAAGSKGLRFAYPNAKIMIHSIQSEAIGGSQAEVELESKRLSALNKTLVELLAKHSGQTFRKVKKDCASDLWLTANQAAKYGIIDGVLNPIKKIPTLKR